VPSRADFEKLNLLIAEAVALCEASQLEFERIHEELRKTIAEGRELTESMVADEDRARHDLFVARMQLLHCRRRLIE
jgi:hypothetical protein